MFRRLCIGTISVAAIIGVTVSLVGIVVTIVLYRISARKVPDSPPPAIYIEGILVERMENADANHVRLGETKVTVMTSTDLRKVPTPLIFQDSASWRDPIILHGEVPGTEFSGNLIITEETHEGLGRFFFEEHVMEAKDGRANEENKYWDGDVMVDRSAPELILTSDQNVYGEESEITMKIETREEIHGISADFSQIDSNCVEPVSQYADLGNNTYRVRHTLSSSNSAPQRIHLVKILAFDSAGNRAVGVKDLFFKHRPYFASIEQNNDGRYRNEDEIAFEARLDNVEGGCDIETDFSLIDSEFYEGAEHVLELGDGLYLISYRISGDNAVEDSAPEIPFIISITARDIAGNKARGFVPLFLDNTPPQFTSIEFTPSSGPAFAREDTISLTVTLDENDCDLRANFTEVDSMFNPTNVHISRLDRKRFRIEYQISATNDTANGEYDIWLTATDRIGNFADKNTPVRLLNFPPRFIGVTTRNRPAYRRGDEIVLTCYLDASSYSLNVGFQDIDRDYDPQTVELLVEEREEQVIYSIRYLLGDDLAPDEFYELVVTASDNAGNQAFDWVTIELNNIPPDGISIIAPESNSHISDEEILFALADQGVVDSDVEGFTIYYKTVETASFAILPGQTRGEWVPGGISYVGWNSAKLPDGTYTLYASVVDRVGNLFTTPSVVVTIDRTSPAPPFLMVDSNDRVALVWFISEIENEIIQYNVYRCTFEGQWIFRRKPQGVYTLPLSTVDAGDLRYDKGAYYQWVDTSDLTAERTYCYVVTAIDRANNESKPSNEIGVTLRGEGP